MTSRVKKSSPHHGYFYVLEFLKNNLAHCLLDHEMKVFAPDFNHINELGTNKLQNALNSIFKLLKQKGYYEVKEPFFFLRFIAGFCLYSACSGNLFSKLFALLNSYGLHRVT